MNCEIVFVLCFVAFIMVCCSRNMSYEWNVFNLPTRFTRTWSGLQNKSDNNLISLRLTQPLSLRIKNVQMIATHHTAPFPSHSGRLLFSWHCLWQVTDKTQSESEGRCLDQVCAAAPSVWMSHRGFQKQNSTRSFWKCSSLKQNHCYWRKSRNSGLRYQFQDFHQKLDSNQPLSSPHRLNRQGWCFFYFIY